MNANAEECLGLLRTRRSIRRFRAEPVSRALVERLIEHAAWAPSAGNRQDWSFVVVVRQDVKRALAEAARQAWAAIIAANRDSGGIEEIERYVAYFCAFSEAPVLIAVACREPDEFQTQLLGSEAAATVGSAASACMAAQNLMLAAHALKLGSCCYTAALAARTEIEARLGLRRGHRLVCLIAVGVPDEAPPPPPRKPLAEIARFIE